MDHLENVDWVSVRAGCTGQHVFRKMKEEVRRDVEVRNRLRGESPSYAFKFSDGGQSFTVALEGSTSPKSASPSSYFARNWASVPPVPSLPSDGKPSAMIGISSNRMPPR